MMIRDMVRGWVKEAYSDAMGVASDEMPTSPSDNYLWGFRSACQTIIDRLMDQTESVERANVEVSGGSQPHLACHSSPG